MLSQLIKKNKNVTKAFTKMGSAVRLPEPVCGRAHRDSAPGVESRALGVVLWCESISSGDVTASPGPGPWPLHWPSSPWLWAQAVFVTSVPLPPLTLLLSPWQLSSRQGCFNSLLHSHTPSLCAHSWRAGGRFGAVLGVGVQGQRASPALGTRPRSSEEGGPPQ